MELPNLNDWAWVETMLNQSLERAITTNIRQVCLSYVDNKWVVTVTLEEPRELDAVIFELITDTTYDYMVDISNKLTPAADALFSLVVKVKDDPTGYMQEIVDSITSDEVPYIPVSLVKTYTDKLDTEENPNKRIVFQRKEPDYTKFS